MGKKVQLPAEGFGIEFIRKLLCFCDITDSGKGIVIHLVRDAVFFQNMLHHLPAVDVYLDHEGEPCLELDMHEAEIFIQVIKVIVFAFTHNGFKFQLSVRLFKGLESLASFHNGEDADKAFRYGVCFQNIKGSLLFWDFGGCQVDQGTVFICRHAFHMGDDIVRDRIGVSGKILQQDVKAGKEIFPPGKGKQLENMPFDDNPVKKGKNTVDFIFVLL